MYRIPKKMNAELTCEIVFCREHAYYLNYQNKRADYIVDFLGSLVNWDFVNEQFAAIKK